MENMNYMAEYGIRFRRTKYRPIFFLSQAKNAYLCIRNDKETRVL